MLKGSLNYWGDVEYLVFSMATMAPSVLLPAALSSGRPWRQSYWLKLNVWVGILAAFGTYFGTGYFFELMGMRYKFPVHWTLGSDVVGRSGGRVPIFMYPLTHAYFMTYFTLLLVMERMIINRLRSGFLGRVMTVLALSYAVAFAETYIMAGGLISDFFAYDNRDRMLRVGSLGYASYFVVGLPMLRRVESNWSIEHVVVEALATCLMILILLEIWAKLVGPL
jgi:cycloeucalenol cycloisomerase